MPKIDLSKVAAKTGSAYPGKFANSMAGRTQQAVGDAAGLTQFGARKIVFDMVVHTMI